MTYLKYINNNTKIELRQNSRLNKDGIRDKQLKRKTIGSVLRRVTRPKSIISLSVAGTSSGIVTMFAGAPLGLIATPVTAAASSILLGSGEVSRFKEFLKNEGYKPTFNSNLEAFCSGAGKGFRLSLKASGVTFVSSAIAISTFLGSGSGAGSECCGVEKHFKVTTNQLKRALSLDTARIDWQNINDAVKTYRENQYDNIPDLTKFIDSIENSKGGVDLTDRLQECLDSIGKLKISKKDNIKIMGEIENCLQEAIKFRKALTEKNVVVSGTRI